MPTKQLNDALRYTAPNSVLKDTLESEDGVPEWLQLTPSRGKFEGRDGRRFNIKKPSAIVKAFNESGEDIQLDLDHKSELPGMFTGEGSASVGWITELASRSGGQIWARVDWTPQGEDLIRNRVFRGLSPVFRVTQDSVEAFYDDPKKNAMEVKQIISVALTNRPNLRLKSLNTKGQPTTHQDNEMNLEQLIAALGLPEGSDEGAVLNSIRELRAPKANPEPTVDLSLYVPKADYDQINAKVVTLENDIAVREAAAAKAAAERHETEVNSAITEALTGGKFAPASEAFYRSGCKTPEGLAAFKAEMNSRKAIIDPKTEEAKDATATAGDVEVTDTELNALAAKSGLTVEELKAARDRHAADLA